MSTVLSEAHTQFVPPIMSQVPLKNHLTFTSTFTGRHFYGFRGTCGHFVPPLFVIYVEAPNVLSLNFTFKKCLLFCLGGVVL